MIAELKDVTKTYRTAPDAPGQTVLSGLDLSIAAGETLAITGPSGCGKSTVLNLLGTLDQPDSGEVRPFGGPDRPDPAATADRARQLLERVGLGRHTDKKPSQLSGGERQRVAVVRALIRGPGLILADEPTGALDASSAAGLMDLLLDLNTEAGTALVLVTHDPVWAARMSRRYRLAEGVLVSAG